MAGRTTNHTMVCAISKMAPASFRTERKPQRPKHEGQENPWARAQQRPTTPPAAPPHVSHKQRLTGGPPRCMWGVILNMGCTPQSPWTMKPKALGMGPQHQYYFKLPRRFHGAAKAENQWSGAGDCPKCRRHARRTFLLLTCFSPPGKESLQ